MLITAGGEYVVYSTHKGLIAYTSSDRVNWALSTTPAFPDGVPWVADYTQGRDPKDIWTPDVQFVPFRSTTGGAYWMYFSASAVFNSRQSAIGVFIIKNKINIYK
jgi:beta-xylosidase